MRAIVIGRFQPFHNGHLAVIKEVAPDTEEVLVGIAAATDSYNSEDPFTAGERNEMITLALREAGIGPFRVINLPDINNYAIWAKYVVSLSPPFDVVVAHNNTTLELFRELGIEARKATPFHRDKFSGTRVRQLMVEAGPWEEMVPPTVADYLERIDGAGRLRRISDQG